jgi:class 3 adenylate cyclase
VVGKKKYVYDIWGDSVNTASRLESTAAIGMINVSESTYENTQEFFEFHSRGKVLAKSKGRIQMYALSRIRPELAEDDKGTKPNERFWRLYKGLRSD